jgi:hypothetical protein
MTGWILLRICLETINQLEAAGLLVLVPRKFMVIGLLVLVPRKFMVIVF